MGKADRGTGIVVLLLGVAVVIGARRLPAEAEFGLGAAFLPFWLGVLLAVLGVGLLFASREHASAEEAALWPADGPAWWRLGAMLGLLAGYVLFLERAGYGLTTFLFLVLCMLALERGRWWRMALISGLSTGALVAIFRGWLKAPLPRGPWGF